VRFNERLHAFARYWGVRMRACAPYRARTKGKDERGVGYVKHNAIAGHRFASWRRSRRILPGGCVRSPTSMSTARPARRRGCASGGMRRRRCGRSTAGRLSDRSASWSAACKPTARSRSTATATACRGASSARACRSWWPMAGSAFAMPRRRSRSMPRRAGRRQRIVEPAHFHGVAGAARPVAAIEASVHGRTDAGAAPAAR